MRYFIFIYLLLLIGLIPFFGNPLYMGIYNTMFLIGPCGIEWFRSGVGLVVRTIVFGALAALNYATWLGYVI